MTPDQIKRRSEINKKIFSDVPKFTLTMTTTDDALWLTNAIVLHLCSGDIKLADSAMRQLAHFTAELGIEEGVDRWLNGHPASKTNPKFLKPLFVHIGKHILK
jgi:hypothetical protein